MDGTHSRYSCIGSSSGCPFSFAFTQQCSHLTNDLGQLFPTPFNWFSQLSLVHYLSYSMAIVNRKSRIRIPRVSSKTKNYIVDMSGQFIINVAIAGVVRLRQSPPFFEVTILESLGIVQFLGFWSCYGSVIVGSIAHSSAVLWISYLSIFNLLFHHK